MMWRRYIITSLLLVHSAQGGPAEHGGPGIPAHEQTETNPTYSFGNCVKAASLGELCAKGRGRCYPPGADCGKNGTNSCQLKCFAGTPCQAFPSATNGFYVFDNSGDVIDGATATLQCCKGWETVQAISIKCLANGTWSSPNGNCTPVQCNTTSLPAIANGKFVEADHPSTFSSIATLQCDSGFVESKSSFNCIKCTADCNWSLPDASLKCIPVCGPLPSVKHGCFENTDFSVNSIATLHCDNGYEPSPANTSRCLPTGKWEQNITCTCIDTILDLGDVCGCDDCSHCKDGLDCIGGYCRCKPGYQESGDSCVSCGGGSISYKLLNDQCTCLDICLPAKTVVCTNLTCACRPGYIKNTTNPGVCIPLTGSSLDDCCIAAVSCVSQRRSFGMVKCEKPGSNPKGCKPNKTCQCNDGNFWEKVGDQCECISGYVPTVDIQNGQNTHVCKLAP